MLHLCSASMSCHSVTGWMCTTRRNHFNLVCLSTRRSRSATDEELDAVELSSDVSVTRLFLVCMYEHCLHQLDVTSPAAYVCHTVLAVALHVEDCVDCRRTARRRPTACRLPGRTGSSTRTVNTLPTQLWLWMKRQTWRQADLQMPPRRCAYSEKRSQFSSGQQVVCLISAGSHKWHVCAG